MGAGLLAGPATPAAAAVPSSFEFEGAGWGHGVGMSQYGAYGQALEGRNHKQILEHYYNPAGLTSATNLRNFDANRELLVQLLHASSAKSSVTVTPESGRLRVIVDGRNEAASRTASPVTLKVSPDGGVVVSGGISAAGKSVAIEWQRTRYWPEGTANTTVAVSGADGGNTDGLYRHGRIEVGVLEGKLNVLNRLRLEGEYLYGIDEMPSSWHSAALEAQAVAARTYALHNANKVQTECGCHVYDEVNSQKFTGWKKEYATDGEYYGGRWKSAVDNTRNRVMTHGGTLIDAVYFSSSGGATRDARHVWGGDVPYLRSRSDEWSNHDRNSNRAWTVRVSQQALAKAFRNKDGVPMNDVVSVALTHGADKAVATATAIGSNGAKVTITGTNLRARLGLKSAWINSITPQKPTLNVDRISGDDRYATAIRISEQSYSQAPVVYVATGLGYADALVAGPAAAHEGGPLLLTRPSLLPEEVRQEIQRLNPGKIVVVGGEGAVNRTVFRELKKLAPGVERRGGDDRYTTAAEVVAEAFDSKSVSAAYVATGLDYPDALSASAVAGAQNAPVLLVRGTAATAPEATVATLQELGVTETVVTGGKAIVSDSILSQLKSYGARRESGTDRFLTNQQLNRELVSSATRAYLATGFDYPDALAGAAVAGAQGAPLYLTRSQCVPAPIHRDVTASPVTQVTLLGGKGVLGETLVKFPSC